MIKPKYLNLQYPQYFTPEIKKFITTQKINENKNEWIQDYLITIPDDFDDKREIGENDDSISKMIRDDNIDEFITFVNKNSISLESEIETSIFETNPLLMKSESVKLIEYSAFFGSIQIFKYLFLNKAKLPPSIWIYAIHGYNPELIHLLEENEFSKKLKSSFCIF